jgi:DnaJ-domain-containing protein 1
MKQTDEPAALRAEIEQKREFVARLEQERTDLELEIAAFEVEYNAQVKPLQDELDAVKLHIEEYEQRNELLRFRGNRLSAMQLEAEVEIRIGARHRPAEDNYAPSPYTRQKWESVSPQPDVAVKTQLKSFYRELAKRFHPDLAADEDEAEREARGARMAEINEAYARGDLEALRRAATLSDARPKLPPTLAELLAERDRLDALVIRLRQDIAELNRDPLMLLKIDAALARHDGRDLLAEMATDLHIQLVEQRGALNRLIAEFRALVEQVGLI